MSDISTPVIDSSWHTDEPHLKCCKVPRRVLGDEARIYKLLLNSHCEHPGKDNGGHECCGKITITRKAILLQCPKCGDAKGLINKNE